MRKTGETPKQVGRYNNTVRRTVSTIGSPTNFQANGLNKWIIQDGIAKRDLTESNSTKATTSIQEPKVKQNKPEVQPKQKSTIQLEEKSIFQGRNLLRIYDLMRENKIVKNCDEFEILLQNQQSKALIELLVKEQFTPNSSQLSTGMVEAPPMPPKKSKPPVTPPLPKKNLPKPNRKLEIIESTSSPGRIIESDTRNDHLDPPSNRTSISTWNGFTLDPDSISSPPSARPITAGKSNSTYVNMSEQSQVFPDIPETVLFPGPPSMMSESLASSPSIMMDFRSRKNTSQEYSNLEATKTRSKLSDKNDSSSKVPLDISLPLMALPLMTLTDEAKQVYDLMEKTIQHLSAPPPPKPVIDYDYPPNEK